MSLAVSSAAAKSNKLETAKISNNGKMGEKQTNKLVTEYKSQSMLGAAEGHTHCDHHKRKTIKQRPAHAYVLSGG